MLPIRTDKQQGKIELLSFWSVRSWVSQFNIAFCCLNLSDATPVRLNLWQGRGGQTISASFSTPDRRLWCFYRKMLCQIYVAKTPPRTIQNLPQFFLTWVCPPPLLNNVKKKLRIWNAMASLSRLTTTLLNFRKVDSHCQHFWRDSHQIVNTFNARS